jgi:hypothetical protein
MSPHTVRAPVYDREHWNRLLRLCHPKGAGDEDLFLWAKGVYDFVTSDEPEPAPREQPKHKKSTDRVDFSGVEERFSSHADLVEHALEVAYSIEEPFHSMLSGLEDLEPAPRGDLQLLRAEQQGCTFKQAAYAAHLANLSKKHRMDFYKLCQSLPMSQRMCGHIIKRLQERESAA